MRSTRRPRLRCAPARPRVNTGVGPQKLKTMPSPEQIVWLAIYTTFGVVGFGLLGYVNVWLADGKRFKEQPLSRKRIIICVSLAQWPYMFIAGYGAFFLVAGWRK